MSFTVTPAGTVIEPFAEFCTSSLFERSSSRAVTKFKYKPRVVDGVPQTVTGVRTRITFKIEE
jgi:protein TonB